jgi:hypothetical protein
MMRLAFALAFVCAGCSKQPKSDCDKFADLEVKCDSTLQDKDKLDLREIAKKICDATPAPEHADIAKKTACAVQTDDCGEYKKCLAAAGLR